MSYTEPLIIPFQLAADTKISSTAKIAFAILERFSKERPEVFNKEICEFLDITYTQLKEIKVELAAAGYLAKIVNTKGQIKYVRMDPALNVLEKIKQFLKLSLYFKPITALDLLTYHADPAKVLHVMSILEFTYRKSSKKIEFPDRILRHGLKFGVKSEDGWTENWWQLELQRAGESAKEAHERAKREAAERDQAIKEQKAFDKYLDKLGRKQLGVLREHAVDCLKANGGIPRIGANTIIKIEMKKIWREGTQSCQSPK